MSRLILRQLVATTALAHPGPHVTASLLHLLAEPDHLALIALGVAALAFSDCKLRARK